MKNMDIREIQERTLAINMFWEREIDKYLKLKPSAMVQKDEIVGMSDALQSGRGGVSSFDLGDLWKQWTTGYQELVRLAADTTKDQSRDELYEIYGVNTPLKNKTVKVEQ